MLKTKLYFLVLGWFRFWAKFKLIRFNGKTIGVTGSVGKSSFIHLLDIVVKIKFLVKTTFHGNSESGLPLEILGLRKYLTDYQLHTWIKIILLAPFYAFAPIDFEVLVAEMGIDGPNEPKNMSYLLKILTPDISVLLNVAPVHTLQFAEVVSKEDQLNEDKLIQAIAWEKGKLVTTQRSSKTAIINIDNKYIKALMPNIKAAKLTFGKDEKADYKQDNYSVSLKNGTSFYYSIFGKPYKLSLKNNVVFEEYGLVILAVIAAAFELEISIESSISIIEKNFRLPPGRMSVLKGINNSIILDSSYNSSPIALENSLNLLNLVAKKGSRIAILGDMRELGELTESKHKLAARFISNYCDYVVLVGPAMKKYTYPELMKLRFPKNKIKLFNTSEKVGIFMKERIKNGDIVLVKGSQNTIFLETAVRDLIVESKKSNEVLCRQNKYWDKVRQEFFTNNQV